MEKVYQNDNQILLRYLIEIYHPDNFDWLSYQITKRNTLTLHHIIKSAEGGLLEVGNAAILTKKSHRALHMCESRDFILYSEINDFFRKIISYRTSLSEELKRESKEYKRALVKTLYK